MPTAPQGQRRPAGATGYAMMVARLATGEVHETMKQPSGEVRSGQAGGKACAEKMTDEARSAVAKKAAEKRWA